MEPWGLSKEACAEVGIEAPDEVVSILFDALHPEVERPASPRSEVSMEAEGRRLIIRIRASDTSALRAALNSYLRWAAAILDVVGRMRSPASTIAINARGES